MSTVVSGANGLVGSRIVARLAEAGEKVIAVGKGPRRGNGAPVEYVEIDLLSHPRKLGQLIEAAQPQGVIHAAAMTDVDACERAPVEAWAINVRAVEEAAVACAGISARFTALSTDYVFDGEKGDYVEDDVPNPRGVYARTKRAGEEAALLLAPGAALCRVAVIFSGREGVKKTFAVGVVESLRAGRPVKAFVDQVVTPTLADNAAEMVLGVHRSDAGGVFHCSGATAVTRVEFCQALASKLGADASLIVPVRLAELKLPAPRPLRAGLRVDKVRRLLGSSAPLPLDAALDRFLDELRR
ncbi:MAG TPA: SDR family oxidoreductase [Myxococcales bacterium]|nr:SDR family oxidoreductase [Myxococcales bacterium]